MLVDLHVRVGKLEPHEPQLPGDGGLRVGLGQRLGPDARADAARTAAKQKLQSVGTCFSSDRDAVGLPEHIGREVIFYAVEKVPNLGLDQAEPLNVIVRGGDHHQKVVVLVENMIRLKKGHTVA